MHKPDRAELVQISQRRITFDRVPLGEEPVVELHLEPGQRVIACDLRSHAGMVGRTTEDWTARVQIETRLGVPNV